jgi:peptidoglycan/xylan/chitin deacetylase (PgdA/CDA1 family)
MNLKRVLSLGVDLVSEAAWRLNPGRSTGSRVPVLCYHRILPDFSEPQTPVYFIPPKTFAAHLERFRSRGFAFLGLDDYAAIAAGRREAPERAVLVSIDDGFADVLPLVPMLKDLDARLTLFLTTSAIGKDGPLYMTAPTPAMSAHAAAHPDLWRTLTWSEVRNLAGHGVSFGLHGHQHRPLAAFSPAELAGQLEEAKALFRRELGAAPTAFALPYGHPSSYNTQLLQVIADAGIELVFSTTTGRSPLPARQLPLSRLVVLNHHTPDDLEKMALGSRDWLGAIKRRLAPSLPVSF